MKLRKTLLEPMPLIDLSDKEHLVEALWKWDLTLINQDFLSHFILLTQEEEAVQQLEEELLLLQKERVSHLSLWWDKRTKRWERVHKTLLRNSELQSLRDHQEKTPIRAWLKILMLVLVVLEELQVTKINT